MDDRGEDERCQSRVAAQDVGRGEAGRGQLSTGERQCDPGGAPGNEEPSLGVEVFHQLFRKRPIWFIEREALLQRLRNIKRRHRHAAAGVSSRTAIRRLETAEDVVRRAL